jgi:hypothetical protein
MALHIIAQGSVYWKIPFPLGGGISACVIWGKNMMGEKKLGGNVKEKGRGKKMKERRKKMGKKRKENGKRGKKKEEKGKKMRKGEVKG